MGKMARKTISKSSSKRSVKIRNSPGTNLAKQRTGKTKAPITTARKPRAAVKPRVAKKTLSKQAAQDVVYKAIHEKFPDAKLSGDQTLKQYGYDGPSSIALANVIYGLCKIDISVGIVACQKLSCVIGLLT